MSSSDKKHQLRLLSLSEPPSSETFEAYVKQMHAKAQLDALTDWLKECLSDGEKPEVKTSLHPDEQKKRDDLLRLQDDIYRVFTRVEVSLTHPASVAHTYPGMSLGDVLKIWYGDKRPAIKKTLSDPTVLKKVGEWLEWFNLRQKQKEYRRFVK